MNDEHQEELAALLALDLLEGAEREQLLAALQRDPALRGEAHSLRETAALLAYAAPEAEVPAGLRGRILAAVEEDGRPSFAKASEGKDARPYPSFFPWAIAAGFAVAAIGLGALYWGGRLENRLLRDQQGLAELELRDARNQLEGERIVHGRELADAREEAEAAGKQVAELDRKLRAEGDLAKFKIATLASMLGNSPEALAVAVWDPARQQGVLDVSKLAKLAADRDYQLWVIDPQYPGAVSAGVFQVDREGGAHLTFRAGRPIKSVAKFAVSLERKGGVAEPQGPIVLLSQ